MLLADLLSSVASERKTTNYTTVAKIATAGMKCKGYMNRRLLICFLLAHLALTFHPAIRFCCLSGEMSWCV
jgi:hypothetical protein